MTNGSKLRVGILGLGQIGGSIALGLKKQQSYLVAGYDINHSLMQAAQGRQAVDLVCSSAAELIEQSQIPIIALPIAGIIETLREYRKPLLSKLAVSDTGSLKSAIMAEAANLGINNFIGGHPLAGTELRGAESWNAALFEGANYFITRNNDTRPESLSHIISLIEALGGVKREIAADVHDMIFATTSNLPHVLAYVLRHLYSERKSQHSVAELFACPSFNGITRVAKSDPEMVFQMLWHNRDNLRRALAELNFRLTDIQNAIDNTDEVQFRRLFNIG